MPFLELKKPGDSADIVIVDIAFISSLELSTGEYSNKVVLSLAGGKTEYTFSYETSQDAQNIFAEIRGELGSDIVSVTI
jgi:hypothetical protein